MDHKALRVLFAEDSAPDRLILNTIISKAGYHAIAAENGQEALDKFEEHKPDIVLLDVRMPVLGGLEAAKILRSKHEDDLIPILFLTSLTDADALAECIEAGGNDFIPKPYNQTVLLSKIKAFARMREMHTTLQEQHAQIERNNQHLIQEQTVAKQVFDQITHTGCLDGNYLKYYISPFAVFNGDVLVADVSPTGSLIVLLGDFTGHGLPAAIGSMPLAATFYGMVRKGFSVSEIMTEINQKLFDILPVGFFCCATCVDINVKERRIRYWGGGLPDGMIYRPKTNEFTHLKSKHLPLGILQAKDFDSSTQRLSMDFGDVIYLWSDGVYEGRNAEGKMFGEDNLHRLLEENKGADDLFGVIVSEVRSHVGDAEKDDDLTLIEIPFDDVKYTSKHYEASEVPNQKLIDTDMCLRLNASSLRQFDPLPLVSHLLNEINGLTPHRTLLYTIVAELYSNALEHGLLLLDSKLKKTPAGFASYYKQRGRRLNELQAGSIEFNIQHRAISDAEGEGGILTFQIKDSGQGFGVEEDWCFVAEPTASNNGETKSTDEHQYFGRGLTLIKKICQKVTIKAPGNDITVEFAWHESDS